MRLTIRQLRKLITEAVATPTVKAGSAGDVGDLENSDMMSGFVYNDDALENKVNLVNKSLTRMGRHVDTKLVKNYVSSLTPQRAMVLTADDIAKDILKKTTN